MQRPQNLYVMRPWSTAYPQFKATLTSQTHGHVEYKVYTCTALGGQGLHLTNVHSPDKHGCGFDQII